MADRERSARWDAVVGESVGPTHVPNAATNRLLDLSEGWVDDRLIEDEALYDVELERIFAEDWTLVAHELQLPGRGDYLTTSVGEDPLLVVRGVDGQIAAFLNSCRHRGLQVCRSETGTAERFVCPHEGWTYALSGELRSIRDQPAEPLVGRGIGLAPVAHLAIDHGWIMVSWSDSRPDRPRWQPLMDATPTGVPQRVSLPVDWKTAAIRLRSFLGADVEQGGVEYGDPGGPYVLGGPYVSASSATVHTLQPRGSARSELTTWRLIGADSAADAAADALAARLGASDLFLDLLAPMTETRVSLRRPPEPVAPEPELPGAARDADHSDEAPSCAPAPVPHAVVRRRLDLVGRGVYSAWAERLDEATRQRLGITGGVA